MSTATSSNNTKQLLPQRRSVMELAADESARAHAPWYTFVRASAPVATSAEQTASDRRGGKRLFSPKDIQEQQLELGNLHNLIVAEARDNAFTAQKLLQSQCLSILCTLERLVELLKSGPQSIFKIVAAQCPSAHYLANKEVFVQTILTNGPQLQQALFDEAKSVALCIASCSGNVLPASSQAQRIKLLLCRQLSEAIDVFNWLVARQTVCSSTISAYQTDCEKARSDFFASTFAPLAHTKAPAEASTSDTHCPMCTDAYVHTDNSPQRRLTLNCCQNKKSICFACLKEHAFVSSERGVKTFVACPFCRHEITLYAPVQPIASADIAVAPAKKRRVRFVRPSPSDQ